jgi:hypothetical protein
LNPAPPVVRLNSEVNFGEAEFPQPKQREETCFVSGRGFSRAERMHLLGFSPWNGKPSAQVLLTILKKTGAEAL